jgi:transposase
MLSEEKVMEILEAYDLTKSYRAAAALAGVDHHTVRRYVAARGAGLDPTRLERPSVADAFADKITEWIERSGGRVRADVVHRRLVAMGYAGSERTTRRVVAALKRQWATATHRVYRPWMPEPGLWLQWDYAAGPVVGGISVVLFCGWLAWSRYRVILPLADRSLASVIAALDRCLRQLGGAPTYALTDNERTVTDRHIAGIAVRNPHIVSAAHYYGITIATCVPADPESKGGSEATVRIAKADLVPTEHNLRDAYADWSELEDACAEATGRFNSRLHREIAARPDERLVSERAHLHAVPPEPYTAAFGQTRRVSWSSTITFRGGRYSVPHALVNQVVWARVAGEELVVVSADATEVARHRLVGRGQASIAHEHYPPRRSDPLVRQPRPTHLAEAEFCAIGEGARLWLVEAAGVGVRGIEAKMADAVALGRLYGDDVVDHALGLAAMAGRFGDADLLSVLLSGRAGGHGPVESDHTLQPGTSSWAGFGAGDPLGDDDDDGEEEGR